ncbi:MAG: hypothetical protein LUF27_04205 [Lachnospiraceae bacterium]|nr:hypothetical protein [Lachnospiraceae bacterium]
MAENKEMTAEEKALLQAKHRQEEVEARNRVRERKARTRRLIQEGALTHHRPLGRRWYSSLRSGTCALHEMSTGHFSRGGR